MTRPRDSSYASACALRTPIPDGGCGAATGKEACAQNAARTAAIIREAALEEIRLPRDIMRPRRRQSRLIAASTMPVTSAMADSMAICLTTIDSGQGCTT
jgi:hypothetical protein